MRMLHVKSSGSEQDREARKGKSGDNIVELMHSKDILKLVKSVLLKEARMGGFGGKGERKIATVVLDTKSLRVFLKGLKNRKQVCF